LIGMEPTPHGHRGWDLRRTTRMFGCFDAGLALLATTLSHTSEHRKQASPIAFRFKDRTHLIAVCSVTIQTPMFQLDPRAAVGLGDEAYFDFCIQSWIKLSIVDVVQLAGYFDQAHLTRSLNHFIGQTPARILQGARQLSFLYKTEPHSTHL
jgi:hypothetical protein